MNAEARKPLLLLGADGMLGRAWTELLQQRGVPFVGATFPTFDLTRPESIPAAVSGHFAAVINCAAYTDVDGAESNEPLANAVNWTGVQMLAGECRRLGVPLVHYSTDYVWDGAGPAPYPPRDPSPEAPPINAYGRSKLAGERAIRESGCCFLIIRTSWLYAPWAKNFVRTIASAARSRPELRVVDDQRGRPTSAEHLALASFQLLEHKLASWQSGIWHITDGGEATWFDFAAEIVRLGRFPCAVLRCSSAEFPRPARRPAFSVLDLEKTEAMLRPMPHWKINLASVMSRVQPL